MKIYDPDIPGYSKLYYNIKKFNNFEEISEINLYEILELVDHFKGYNKDSGYDGYKSAMSYLTTTFNCMKLNFDAKIIFLILCCDPCLVHFYTFISTPIISLDEIKELEFDDEIQAAKMSRIRQLRKLEEDIKYQIDFYDPNLIHCEFAFFKKFCSDKILLNNIRLDMMSIIRSLCANHFMMKTITHNEIIYLLDTSDKYLQHIGNKQISLCGKTVVFNTYYQGDILGLFNNAQKLFFFISTIDRECRAAQLSDKSLSKKTCDEIGNQIGFYDEKFIEAEKTYRKIMGI